MALPCSQWTKFYPAAKESSLTNSVVTYVNVLKEVTLGWPKEDIPRNEGALVKKDKWTDARLSDIFMGEEVSNFMYVDIAKVQNFFFTMIALVAYSVTLAVSLSTSASIAGFFLFPDLPAGLIAVISISHGGYLTDKAFTHTEPTEPPPDSD